MYQLSQIKAEVNKLAKLIGANQHQLPTYGRSRDLGYTHVEVDENFYHLVCVERGGELERNSTSDFNELLYLIFSDATFDIASNYEVKNRIENQDSRRLLFKKQIDLMYSINSKFGQKLETEITKVLDEHPFKDNRSNGA